MATGRLGAEELLVDTDTTLYQCPSDQFAIVTANICNKGTEPALISVAVCTLETPDPAEFLEFETSLLPHNILERTSIMMSADQYLVVKSDSLNVSAVAYGFEIVAGPVAAPAAAPAATELVGFTQVRNNPTSGGNTLTQSADILPGDLLVTVISGGDIYTETGQFYNTPTVTGVGPWTEVLDQGVLPNLYVAYKTAVSADASYDQYWSWEGTQKTVITCLVFRNAEWDTIGTVGTGVSTDPVTAGAISTSAPNSRIIAVLAATYTGAIGDMDAPWSPIVEAETGGYLYGSQKIHQQVQTSSGAVGPTTHSTTNGASTARVGHVQFSIKPLNT